MTWCAELKIISGNEDVIGSVLANVGYKFVEDKHQDSGKWLLEHPKYSEVSSSKEVYTDAIEIIEKFNKTAQIEKEDSRLEFVSVRYESSSGIMKRHFFAELSTCVLGGAQLRGEGRIIRNSHLSEDEIIRRIKEAEELEKKKKEATLIRRMSSALTKPAVLYVMELLSISDPSMTELGHIIELIVEDCDGDLTEFTTKAEQSRFERSINHPSVMGLKARHAVSKNQLPPKPMNENEAKSFAHRVGQEWLRKQNNKY
ncbi:MAG: hypothetical protein KME14_25780 [Tildeniella torsiva UHER 1998/13D]|jgi:hypothetical protein|nr:hypothetical protein [Tildeniella torsiva UHER 1998/13D]